MPRAYAVMVVVPIAVVLVLVPTLMLSVVVPIAVVAAIFVLVPSLVLPVVMSVVTVLRRCGDGQRSCQSHEQCSSNDFAHRLLFKKTRVAGRTSPIPPSNSCRCGFRRRVGGSSYYPPYWRALSTAKNSPVLKQDDPRPAPSAAGSAPGVFFLSCEKFFGRIIPPAVR